MKNTKNIQLLNFLKKKVLYIFLLSGIWLFSVVFGAAAQSIPHLTWYYLIQVTNEKGEIVKSLSGEYNKHNFRIPLKQLGISNQLPQIYHIQAKIYAKECPKECAAVQTTSFRVEDVKPFLKIVGPSQLDVTKNKKVTFNIKARTEPSDAPYTTVISGITLSPKENTEVTRKQSSNSLASISLSFDPSSHVYAERYKVKVRACLDQLPDKCSEVTKTLVLTGEVPSVVKLRCPEKITAGQRLQCMAYIDKIDKTLGPVKIAWKTSIGKELLLPLDHPLETTPDTVGNFIVSASVKYTNLPFLRGKATIAKVKIISPRLDLQTYCYNPEWQVFIPGKCYIPLSRDSEERKGLKITLMSFAHSFTPQITIIDNNTGTVLKTITFKPEKYALTRTVYLAGEDLGMTEPFNQKDLLIKATYKELKGGLLTGRYKVELPEVVTLPSTPKVEIVSQNGHPMIDKATVKVTAHPCKGAYCAKHYKARLLVFHNGKLDRTEFYPLDSSGSIVLTYPVKYEGKYEIRAEVKVVDKLDSKEKTLNKFLSSPKDYYVMVSRPVKVNLKPRGYTKNFAPFDLPIIAQISPEDQQRVAGMEWILKNSDGKETVLTGNSTSGIIPQYTVHISTPGEYELFVRTHTKLGKRTFDSDPLYIAGLGTPKDVQNAFGLALNYNPDSQILVRVDTRKLKQDALIKKPVREKLRSISWKVIDESTHETALSGNSGSVLFKVDASGLDLNRNYALEVRWHTSLGRDFIATADIDENRIKSGGVDLSGAEVRVRQLTPMTPRYQVYLYGFNTNMARRAGIKPHIEVLSANGNIVAQSDNFGLVTNLANGNYTARVRLSRNGNTLYTGEKSFVVDLKHKRTNSHKTRLSNEEFLDMLANRIQLRCFLYDPFAKQVMCIVGNINRSNFLRRGYEADYCIRTTGADKNEVCNRNREIFTYENGGNAAVTLEFKWGKSDSMHTVTRKASVDIPSSIKELFDKNLKLFAEIYNPETSTVRLGFTMPDRFIRMAFLKRYTFKLELLDGSGEVVQSSPVGRPIVFYEIPPSTESNYALTVRVYRKKDLSTPVYTARKDFSFDTLKNDMAELEIKRIVGRITPWGVYRITPRFSPPRVVRYLYWTVKILDESGNEIMKLEHKGRRYIQLPAPGTYRVEFVVSRCSDHSAVLITKNYTVKATNEPPTITYKRADALYDYRKNHVAFVEIAPKDPDGRVKEIEISACGVTKHYARAIINCHDAQSVDVHVKVCDDAGACTEDTRTITW